MGDPIGEMTQPYVENDKTMSMKVTPCIMEAAFADPFPQDLESLFLEKDAATTGFTIEDKGTVKHESASTEETTWPALFNLGGQGGVSGPVKIQFLLKRHGLLFQSRFRFSL